MTTEAAFDGSTLALPELSAAAAEFVQQHPDEARVAVTAALEAVAAQFDSLNRDESIIPAALRPFVVEASPSACDGELIGAEEAVCRLAVSRATVYNWIESQRLLGWRLARQGTLIPAEQMLGPGELVPGIERVLEIIPGRAPRGASSPRSHRFSALPTSIRQARHKHVFFRAGRISASHTSPIRRARRSSSRGSPPALWRRG